MAAKAGRTKEIGNGGRRKMAKEERRVVTRRTTKC